MIQSFLTMTVETMLSREFIQVIAQSRKMENLLILMMVILAVNKGGKYINLNQWKEHQRQDTMVPILCSGI